MCGRNVIMFDVFTGGCCIICSGWSNWVNLNVEGGQRVNDRSIPCKTAPTLPWHQYEAIRMLSIPSNKTDRLLSSKYVSLLDCLPNSVVTRWTVDQKVVGSNPTHDWNLISVVRSLSGFTQPIRQNEYRLSVAGVHHIELGLKIQVCPSLIGCGQWLHRRSGWKRYPTC